MLGIAGFREVAVFKNVTNGTLTNQASCCEVTNSGATEVTIYLNDFPLQGHPTNGVSAKGIPIAAGQTRYIPMALYNFNATGAVTVVAYYA